MKTLWPKRFRLETCWHVMPLVDASLLELDTFWAGHFLCGNCLSYVVIFGNVMDIIWADVYNQIGPGVTGYLTFICNDFIELHGLAINKKM